MGAPHGDRLRRSAVPTWLGSGCAALVFWPLPSWPKVLLPQHHAAPSSSSPQVFDPDALIAVKTWPSAERPGCVWSSAASLPSWPDGYEPQHHASPASVSAHTWPWPVASSVKAWSPRTATGCDSFSVGPAGSGGAVAELAAAVVAPAPGGTVAVEPAGEVATGGELREGVVAGHRDRFGRVVVGAVAELAHAVVAPAPGGAAVVEGARVLVAGRHRLRGEPVHLGLRGGGGARPRRAPSCGGGRVL